VVCNFDFKGALGAQGVVSVALIRALDLKLVPTIDAGGSTPSPGECLTEGRIHHVLFIRAHASDAVHVLQPGLVTLCCWPEEWFPDLHDGSTPGENAPGL
jgi:hypothetical protein